VVELYSPEFRDFVKLCCTKDPNDRPTQHKILSHKWLSGDYPSVDMAEWARSTQSDPCGDGGGGGGVGGRGGGGGGGDD
jgi:uncharacterized membrane protein